jgi:hypothetical protein
MTLPRSAADVLASHVVFELECIDRVYCNLYVPKLQRDLGVVGFIREHLGMPVASTAALQKKTEGFYAEVRAFAAREGVPVVDFRPGQRKDDVMREHLARFLAGGGTEGVVFIGRAQEKVSVWATTRRRDAEGKSYPWIVRESRVVTQWYFYCRDACAGPFFLKYCGYFPYNAKLYLLTELRGVSSQFRGQVPVRVDTVPPHDRIRGTVTESGGAGGASAGFAGGDRGAVRAFPAA